MILSLKWLREFVPFEGTAQELGDRLTMLGLENEAISRPFAEIEEVVVGHVISCEQHPDADKLRVCQVDVNGPEILTIVCGAPNVRAGLNVPVALVGSTLPGGFKISKAKLRGVVSLGMICSERELHLSEDHAGIMELPEHFKPGVKLVDALDLDTEVCEIGITPNRGDCLSILGLAREVGLSCNLPVTIPALDQTGANSPLNDMQVEIANPDDCPLYYGKIIDNVKIGPSAQKIRYRLIAAGMRPVSNVVDVTNYIMLELGQPLHSFDMQNLEGGKIVVQRATQGMRFTTLDGQERTLHDNDLMIWDGKKPVALAGVMGGQNSEITSSSSQVFLESAVFAPNLVRRTARRLALPSDASYRFERGVDQNISLIALNRAATLIAQSSGGTVRAGLCGQEAKPWAARKITFSPAKASKLLGVTVDDAFCRQTLKNVGCKLENDNNEIWTAYPPSYRNDIILEADLVEEVGRVYGLDKIEPTLPKVSRALLAATEASSSDCMYAFLMRLKHWASALGLNEVINYSFVGQKDLDLLTLPQENRISIMNPLSAEQDVLRLELAPGLLNTLRNNIAQGCSGLRVFELARSFSACPKSETSAHEVNRLAIMMYGARHNKHWPQTQADVDYLDIKGVVENLLEFFHLASPKTTAQNSEQNSNLANQNNGLEFRLVSSHNYLLPCVEILLHGQVLGLIGQVKPEMADLYHARKAVWLADLDTDLLFKLVNANTILFEELPQFPPVRRDITVICPLNLSVDEVLSQTRQIKMPLLKEVELIDVFTPEDKSGRNLTFRFTFRHESRTLKDAEVDKEREKMAEFLLKSLPVRI